jgi:hypothetical protein
MYFGIFSKGKVFNWKKMIKENQIFLSFYFSKTYLSTFSKGQLGPPLDSTYLIKFIAKMCLFNKKTTHTHVIATQVLHSSFTHYNDIFTICKGNPKSFGIKSMVPM